jgi:hypothetical protein
MYFNPLSLHVNSHYPHDIRPVNLNYVLVTHCRIYLIVLHSTALGMAKGNGEEFSLMCCATE